MLCLVLVLICNLVFMCGVNGNDERVQITDNAQEHTNKIKTVEANHAELKNVNIKSDVQVHGGVKQNIVAKTDQVASSKNDTSDDSKSDNNNSTIPHLHFPSKADLMQSGALLRGFYVFLGLSVLMIMYLLCRSHRLRHGGQPSTTVRKYGVKARRSDIEMRPLEMDDEDDDTLFDIQQNSKS